MIFVCLLFCDTASSSCGQKGCITIGKSDSLSLKEGNENGKIKYQYMCKGHLHAKSSDLEP